MKVLALGYVMLHSISIIKTSYKLLTNRANSKINILADDIFNIRVILADLSAKGLKQAPCWRFIF